jgi:hypothetical protein
LRLTATRATHVAARARCAALQGTAVLAGNGDLRLARQVRLTRAKESRKKKKRKRVSCAKGRACRPTHTRTCTCKRTDGQRYVHAQQDAFIGHLRQQQQRFNFLETCLECVAQPLFLF